jgi:DNA polymerase bacteriophage-type
MRALHIDTETRSAVDLGKVGSYLYARHPITDLRCASYGLVTEGVRSPIETWWPGDPVPADIAAAAEDPDTVVLAFNNAFDRQIWNEILTPRYGWPAIPLVRHRCAQAAALARALPASLDAAAAVLKIKTRKSKQGMAMMKRLAGPRRQSAKDRKAGVPLDFSATAEELATLGEYNRDDVAMMREVVDRVGLLPPAEQELWQLDQIINERGVHVDIGLLESGLCIGQEAQAELQERIAELTGGAITSSKQVQRIVKWLGERGCQISNVRKRTVSEALLAPGLDPQVRALLELRRDGAGAAALKFATLRRWTSEDGEPRIRYAYRFDGASSGRWTSIGCQIHNLVKPELANVSAAIAAVATSSLTQLRQLGFDRPLETIGQISRATVCAAPGKRLFIADLSGIEARGAAYVCGAAAELAQWREFDRSGRPEDEPYYRTGSATFAQPPEKARKAGKIGSLAFQYQGGIGAYRCITGDLEISDEVVTVRRDAWRRDHPDYTQFWQLAVFQAVQAIRNPGTEFTARVVTFKYELATGFLEVTLPSGRVLSYPCAELFVDEQYGTVSFTFFDASGSKTGRMYHERRGSGAFGGLMLENIVQAICRDIFVAAMPRLEAAGYTIVMHSHDEWVCEVPEGSGSLEEFLRIAATPPRWAPDFPIAAKARISDRFIEIPEATQAAEVVTDNTIDNAMIEDDESELIEDLLELEVPEEVEPERELEIQEPAPEPVRGICIYCRRDPADGLERISAYGGAWLHPQCEGPLLQARLAQEGVPWERPGEPPAASPPPPPAPPPPPLSQPSRSNGAGNGASNGMGYGAASAGNGLGNGVGNSRDARGYPFGENPGPSTGSFGDQYIYKNATGRLHMRVVKTATKNFPTWFWSTGDWVLGWPKEVVPYRLPELLAAPADGLVLICEGEKDCETAVRNGFVATTNPGGAKVWQPELAQYFQGKQRVCIVEDNDIDGAKHTALILQALGGVVPVIGVVRFPELGPGGDVSDYFAAGGSKPYLLTRIDAALKAGTVRPYVIVPASEVELENVSWLWPGHLAHGALELLTGDPDLGKSQVHMSYAACVTRGMPWPDGYPGSEPQQVLLVTAEDNYANTVGPRAVAAGADRTKLIYFKGLIRNGKQEIFLLSSGLQELEQILLDYDDIGLVLIDPITAYMGSPASGRRFDSHRATDVRSVLGPVKDLAERHRIAISAITHPPKGAKASPLDSYIGSQAYIAAARIGHLCIPETEPGLAGAVRSTGRVFFTQVKNNLGSKATTLAYHLDTKSIGFDRFGAPLKPAPYVAWEGVVDITSAEALAQARAVAKTRVNPVHEFLRDILASGPVLQKVIVERGAAKGISLPQLRRARKAIGAVTFKRRGGNVISPWLWALPEYVPDDVEREEDSPPEGDA